MENNDNNWSQRTQDGDDDINEGKSSLDKINQDNQKREHGDWSDWTKKGSGDYGAEGGRSDDGVTGGETDISRPLQNDQQNPSLSKEEERAKNDQWNAQHPGELPV